MHEPTFHLRAYAVRLPGLLIADTDVFHIGVDYHVDVCISIFARALRKSSLTLSRIKPAAPSQRISLKSNNEYKTSQ